MAARRGRPHHHSVYVVELSKEVLNEPRFRKANQDYRLGFPCVYVGMTGLSPDVRFDKHKAGIQSNKFVRALRPAPPAAPLRGVQPDAVRRRARHGSRARHRAAREGLRRLAGIVSLTAGETAYCGAVLLLAYSLRGSTGFGGLIGMPLLALVIPVKVLAPAWTLLGIASSATILGGDRAHVDKRAFAFFLPWCVLGIGVGLYLFTALDAATLARALGVLVLPMPAA